MSVKKLRNKKYLNKFRQKETGEFRWALESRKSDI